MDIASLGNFLAASRFAADGAVDGTLRNEILKKRSANSPILVVPAVVNSLLMPPMPTDEVEQEENPTQKFEQKARSRVNLMI